MRLLRYTLTGTLIVTQIAWGNQAAPVLRLSPLEVAMDKSLDAKEMTQEESRTVTLLNAVVLQGYEVAKSLIPKQIKVGYEYHVEGDKVKIYPVATLGSSPEDLEQRVKVVTLYNGMLDPYVTRSKEDFKTAVRNANLSFTGLTDLLVLVGAKFEDGYEGTTGLNPRGLSELIENAQRGEKNGGICGDIHAALAEIAEASGVKNIDATVVMAKYGKTSHKTLLLYDAKTKRYVWFNYGNEPLVVAQDMQNKEMALSVLARAMGYTQTIGVQEYKKNVYSIISAEGQWVGYHITQDAKMTDEPRVLVDATNQSQNASIAIPIVKNIQVFGGYHRFTSRYSFDGVATPKNDKDDYQLGVLGIASGGRTQKRDIKLPGGLVVPQVQVEGDISAGIFDYKPPRLAKNKPVRLHGFAYTEARVSSDVTPDTTVSTGLKIKAESGFPQKNGQATLVYPYNIFDLTVEYDIARKEAYAIAVRAQGNAEVQPKSLAGNGPTAQLRDVNLGLRATGKVTEKLVVYADGAIYGIQLTDGIGLDVKSGVRYVLGDTRIIKDITLELETRYKAIVANSANLHLFEDVHSLGFMTRLRGKLKDFIPYVATYVEAEAGLQTQNPTTIFGSDAFDPGQGQAFTPEVVDGLDPYARIGITLKPKVNQAPKGDLQPPPPLK